MQFLNNAYGIAFILILMVFWQRLLVIPQARHLNKQISEIKKTGPVSSIGLSKHWYGNQIYILITERDGTIIQGYKVKGKSVFADFEKDTQLKAATYVEILETLHAKKKRNGAEQALWMAAMYLEKGLKDQEV